MRECCCLLHVNTSPRSCLIAFIVFVVWTTAAGILQGPFSKRAESNGWRQGVPAHLAAAAIAAAAAAEASSAAAAAEASSAAAAASSAGGAGDGAGTDGTAEAGAGAGALRARSSPPHPCFPLTGARFMCCCTCFAPPVLPRLCPHRTTSLRRISHDIHTHQGPHTVAVVLCGFLLRFGRVLCTLIDSCLGLGCPLLCRRGRGEG